MNFKDIKKISIPETSGSYQFLDKKGKIIYVGKAENLRSRIFSYWQKSANHTPAKYAMIKRVKEIKWIKTESEIEALLLEANLIKKHQPKYNIVLRDDKRYIYIKISIEKKWPRVFIARKLEKTGKYFGPFVSAGAVRETLKAVRKIWPYRSCKNLPKKACLYYRIGKCPGMCEYKISEKEYKKVINQINLFLQGKKNGAFNIIKKEIKDLKLKIKNFKIESDKYKGIFKKISMLKYRMANINNVLEHANILGLIDKYASDAVELAKVLGLSKVPERIEGYDISNIFGRHASGSMVVFSDGEPNKSEYRKFNIKIGQGKSNDIKMLKEILERRFKNTWTLPDLIIIDGGRAQLNAAINVIKRAEMDLTAIAISKGNGLRSARAHDKIFFPGEKDPLELPLASPALHIIKRVRDEAHRFAVSYHIKMRKKKFLN